MRTIKTLLITIFLLFSTSTLLSANNNLDTKNNNTISMSKTHIDTNTTAAQKDTLHYTPVFGFDLDTARTIFTILVLLAVVGIFPEGWGFIVYYPILIFYGLYSGVITGNEFMVASIFGVAYRLFVFIALQMGGWLYMILNGIGLYTIAPYLANAKSLLGINIGLGSTAHDIAIMLFVLSLVKAGMEGDKREDVAIEKELGGMSKKERKAFEMGKKKGYDDGFDEGFVTGMD